ncbi:hypothetical protein ACJJTC_013990 [Scirpophaga incertulas]
MIDFKDTHMIPLDKTLVLYGNQGLMMQLEGGHSISVIGSKNLIPINVVPDKPLGFRHVQTLLLFFMTVISFMFRNSISMAVVVMTDSNKEDSFDWSIKIQSLILSSFMWIYVITQFPGGVLVARFKAKLAAKIGGWQLVIVCRIAEGAVQGWYLPCLHVFIAKWVPLDERSRLGTFIYSGSQLGIAIQYLISGYIIHSWSWEAIFYVNGAIGTMLVILFCIFGADSPQTSKWMSEGERLYIQTSLNEVVGRKNLKTPWKKIWTSMGFISLIVANCGQNWGLWTLMTLTPSYLDQVQGVDIKANGVISAIPYLCMVAMSFVFGYGADLIIKKKWLSITMTRKISNSIGFFVPGLALIGLSYAPADPTLAVLLLTAVVMPNAGRYSGYMLAHIDMAPNFAGQMSGITNGFANTLSIFAPLAAGFMLQDETNPGDWRKVFYLTSAIYIVSNIFYIIYGDSSRQSWNDPETDIGYITYLMGT